MSLLRRLRAGLQNLWAVAELLSDRELLLAVVWFVVGLFVGVFDRVFKKRGDKW